MSAFAFSFLFGTSNVAMSLHVSLCHLESHCNLTSSLHSRVVSRLRLRNHLRIVYFHVTSLFEGTEEFKASVLFNWSEHSNCLLHDSRVDRDVRAAVGLA